MTFADVVREVYGHPAAEFVSARTEASRAAAAAGDRDLAKQISGLKKPSAAAAAVNALMRSDGGRIGELTTLHDEFADAQDDGDREALQRLGMRRRELISELTSRARELVEATGAGLSATAADEVGATLLAAIADGTAARALASGCLVRALSANGVDPADIDDAVAVPIAGLAAVPGSGRPRRSSSGSATGNAAEKKARAALKDAMRAATRANADLERSDAARRRSEQSLERLHSERDELRERLAELEATIDTATGELEGLVAAHDAAADAARAAEAAVEAASASAPHPSPKHQ